MYRIVVPVVFLAVVMIANLAEACGRCGRAACRQPATCVYAAPVCATPTYSTRYENRYVTCYKTVVTMRPVTTMKRVSYLDECGVCRVKCCPETRQVRCVKRVPYTVCRTVAIRTPCYAPMASPMVACYAPAPRRSCLGGNGCFGGGGGLFRGGHCGHFRGGHFRGGHFRGGWGSPGCGLFGGLCSSNRGCW